MQNGCVPSKFWNLHCAATTDEERQLLPEVAGFHLGDVVNIFRHDSYASPFNGHDHFQIVIKVLYRESKLTGSWNSSRLVLEHRRNNSYNSTRVSPTSTLKRQRYYESNKYPL
ncbi:DNA damage-binding protein 1-like isoform X2 [Eurosta solidaginis]|uniref:DNA damage-binding protein 1-like isoform X2 n=1 Tax=Eurosta solidaginis TaxID=178769 RepID=UPI003530FC0D